MSRALVIASVVLASLGASAATAEAGTYLGLGVGTAADTSGGADQWAGAGRSYRVLGGLRFGRLSVEASVSGQDLQMTHNGGGMFDGRQVALAGKYSHPLGSGLELYGKLGAHRTWLSGDAAFEAYDVSGDGLLVGGGIELRLSAIVASGSLFIDYTHHAAEMSGDRYAFDAGVGMWMAGLTLGL